MKVYSRQVLGTGGMMKASIGSAMNTELKAKRIFYLDNLKIALTCLVVAHHASQGFCSVDTGWPVQQGDIPEINDRLIGWFLSVNNAFFMSLFFMISSYFIPSSLERKTTSEFWADRFKKLGIPVLLITCIVLPFTGFFLNGGGMSFSEFVLQKYFNISHGEINLGHTWFLFVLLAFTCIYLLYIKILKGKVPRGVKDSQRKAYQASGTLKNIYILLFAIGLTAITFVVRIYFRPGYWIMFHIFEPARILTYLAMFIFGIRAFRQKWFEKLSASAGLIWGVFSIILILLAPPIILFRVGGYSVWAEGFSLNSLIVCAWETFLCVGLCISLPILFRQKFNTTNKILKIASEKSFGVYLLHPFILIPMDAIILEIPIHPFFKFIMVSIVGIIICYFICYLYAEIKSLIYRAATKILTKS